MTIENYLKENGDWHIDDETELEFANPKDEKEAKENLQWAIDNQTGLHGLAVVVKSYYGGVIEWESF